MKDRIIESGLECRLQIRLVLELEQAWDKNMYKNKTKRALKPLSSAKSRDKSGLLYPSPTNHNWREMRNGTGGVATVLVATPRCAHQPGASSTSLFVAGEGRYIRREIERTKERERKWGPGSRDSSGSTTPAIAGLMSSRDPNSRLLTERGFEWVPQFRGLGFETHGASPPRPPLTGVAPVRSTPSQRDKNRFEQVGSRMTFGQQVRSQSLHPKHAQQHPKPFRTGP